MGVIHILDQLFRTLDLHGGWGDDEVPDAEALRHRAGKVAPDLHLFVHHPFDQELDGVALLVLDCDGAAGGRVGHGHLTLEFLLPRQLDVRHIY